jgi:hypothetical protein
MIYKIMLDQYAHLVGKSSFKSINVLSACEAAVTKPLKK